MEGRSGEEYAPILRCDLRLDAGDLGLMLAVGQTGRPQAHGKCRDTFPYRGLFGPSVRSIHSSTGWDEAGLPPLRECERKTAWVGRARAWLFARSTSMHSLAKDLSTAGYEAYALDIRGHGESGEKGRVAYVGQLEDDSRTS